MELVLKNVVENEDGSCTVDIDYDNETLQQAMTWAAGQEGLDLKDVDAVMQAFVIDLLEDAIKKAEEKNIDADK